MFPLIPLPTDGWSNLKGPSGVRRTTFGNFRITVGFGNRKKTKRDEGGSGGERKAARTDWTDFSDLEQYL